MNNSNALAEIQSKYPNCNLLLPAATSVQINPFYNLNSAAGTVEKQEAEPHYMTGMF